MPELFRAYLLGGIYRLGCTESSRFGWDKHRPRAPGGRRAASPTQAEMRAYRGKSIGPASPVRSAGLSGVFACRAGEISGDNLRESLKGPQRGLIEQFQIDH